MVCVVRFIQVHVCRQSIRLICIRFRIMDKRDTVKERIQLSFSNIPVLQVLVPFPLL